MANSQIRVGVVSTGAPRLRKRRTGAIRRPAPYFCELARHVQKLDGRLLLFAPDHVHWRRRLVSAWTPRDPKMTYGDWVRTTEALPDVFYDNVYVHLAVRGYVTDLRRRAEKAGIPVINPVLPNKWHMVRWMVRHRMQDVVPETTVLDDVDEALQLIKRWKVAYLKPIGGYGGTDVMRIERLNANRYRVSVDRTRTSFEKQRFTVSKVRLRKLLRRRSRPPHLLQRGLSLLTVRGRKNDFRVVVHRGYDNDWRVIGIIPKQAAPDGVVTNLVAGGERLSLDQCLRLAKAENKEVPVQLLEDTALRIARQLGRRYVTAGLLGFDMGIDQQGRVYLIEMNPKPARSLLTPEMRHAAAKHTAGFAVYLAQRDRKTAEHSPEST
ncbi:MAG: YheC/YheD family protein [Alicyclobacillus sp.]|nr:YheC/YheD family protein [Alicyclobacillus sp.]